MNRRADPPSREVPPRMESGGASAGDDPKTWRRDVARSDGPIRAEDCVANRRIPWRKYGIRRRSAKPAENRIKTAVSLLILADVVDHFSVIRQAARRNERDGAAHLGHSLNRFDDRGLQSVLLALDFAAQRHGVVVVLAVDDQPPLLDGGM